MAETVLGPAHTGPAAQPSGGPFGLVAAAQAYVDDAALRGDIPPVSMVRLLGARVCLDVDFCTEVAQHFAGAPLREDSPALLEGYARLKEQTLRQFGFLRDTGLRVEPWLGPGQPYRGSRDLTAKLAASRVLYVYLTTSGHGPGRSVDDHPMCEPSDIRVRDVDLLYNDLFRAVHDLFGHVMLGSSMTVAGEFRAAYVHMAMYSPAVHPVVFSEHVSQICWYFYGPHLMGPSGRVPERGDPGWVPHGERPYPEQKVFSCPAAFVDRFKSSFVEASG
jgi:hypothetical protein